MKLSLFFVFVFFSWELKSQVSPQFPLSPSKIILEVVRGGERHNSEFTQKPKYMN